MDAPYRTPLTMRLCQGQKIVRSQRETEPVPPLYIILHLYAKMQEIFLNLLQ